MFRPKKPENSDYRTDYAQVADFCEVFEKDMKPLYLLAFLLTANHKDAEQCFASVAQDWEANSVFKAWIASWIKRRLVTRAIHIVFFDFARTGEQRNLWWEGAEELRVSRAVNAVTSLEDLERFVFVMSVLEGYTSRECSLLLKCAAERIVPLWVQASRRLAASDPFFVATPAGPLGRRESA
jgi:DNA-directed RNA polymerase specialized sigma24 family protein